MAPLPVTAPPSAAPANPLAGLSETALFQLLSQPLAGSTPPKAGAFGSSGGFAPGTMGHSLAMLFGGGMQPQLNPNDVANREGGATLGDPNDPSSQAYNSPSAYFQRMAAQAMGNPTPAAPVAPIAPKPVVKPVAPIKPVPVQNDIKPIAQLPSTTTGFTAGDAYKTPEATAAAATPAAVTPVTPVTPVS